VLATVGHYCREWRSWWVKRSADSVERVNSATSSVWLWLLLHATWLLPDWCGKWQRLLRRPTGDDPPGPARRERARHDRERGRERERERDLPRDRDRGRRRQE
jgi:hypothetical protein